MNFKFSGYLIAIAILLSSCGGKPTVVTKSINTDSIEQVKLLLDSSRKDFITGKALSPIRDKADMNFSGRAGNYMYYCSAKGKIERSDTTGDNRVFLFDLHGNYIIDRIYILPLEDNDVIASWQETTYMGMSSHVIRFTPGSEKEKWLVTYKAPDPGVPLVYNGYVYVSTLGIIGKLNAESGEAAWLHDSLYETTSMRFKKFDVPKIYSQSVVFFDFPIQGRKGKRDSIWVDDRTGKLIR
jgi:outer membrane protein assembly factor BamB